MRTRQHPFNWPGRLIGFLLFVQLMVPSSVWHLFVDHEDNQHCVLQTGGDAIGLKHNHCAALDLSLPVADQSDDYRFEPLPFIALLAFVPSVSDLCFILDFSHFLRGPPFRFS